MEFHTNHIGAYGGHAAKLIELTVEGNGCSIVEDVTSTSVALARTRVVFVVLAVP